MKQEVSAAFLLITAVLLLLASALNPHNTWATQMPNKLEDKWPAEKVDELFREYDSPNTPGAAVAVMRDGTVVLSKGYGMAQLEYHIPITPETVFDIASMSKAFTALAITMLEKQGKLSVDDEIHKYLPELPDFGRPIRIRHLLHHTSGLRDDLTLWVLSGNSIEDVITQKDLLALVQTQNQLNFPPGSKYGYSDTNYDLLAEIVSAVAGESFSSWTQRNIFIPLGMTSSRFVEDHAMLIAGRARCYEMNDSGQYRNVTLNMGWVGSSGMHTTLQDMAKWIANIETRQVGGEEVFNALLTPGVLDNGDHVTYARGVRIEEYHGQKVIMHSGTNGAFSCHMSYFPRDRLGVIILSNCASNPWDMAAKVADLFIHQTSTDQSLVDIDTDRGADDAHSARIPAMLTGDQLAACCGSYWYKDSWNWLVRGVVAENGKLYYVRSQDNRTELIPLSDTEFELAGEDRLVVRFSENADGAFTVLTFNDTGAEPMEAVRVECLAPSEQQLREYEGLYYAKELDALSRLIVQEGELRNAKFRYAPDTRWVPVTTDRFVFMDREGHVSFRRDGRGGISGYVVDFPRAENILFERLKE
ncbi:MAG: beta-lactamase family protein [Phycisphaerae bacterium]|nr:beta-lactamase family protein [Phycisphaerae bacterium]